MACRKSILIVGVGSIGERHLRCFKATGRAEVSLCEVNPDLRKTVAERYGVTNVFDDFDRALENKPDAVVICTPAHLHIPMALKVVRSGIHLLIEKPLSTTLKNIDELVEEIVKRKLIAGVAYVYRAIPALAGMREAIIKGRFGEPVQIVATFGQNFPFYRPAYRETYYKSRATGGGAIQDALTHVINMGEWLAGPIHELVADAAHQVLDGVDVEDTVHLLTRHGNVMGSYAMNQHQAPNEGCLTVICKKGTARFETHTNVWRWQTRPDDQWHEEAADKLAGDPLFTRQAELFLDTLEELRPPLCTVEEALQTLRATLKIFDSIEKRRWEVV